MAGHLRRERGGLDLDVRLSADEATATVDAPGDTFTLPIGDLVETLMDSNATGDRRHALAIAGVGRPDRRCARRENGLAVAARVLDQIQADMPPTELGPQRGEYLRVQRAMDDLAALRRALLERAVAHLNGHTPPDELDERIAHIVRQLGVPQSHVST